MPRMPPHDVRRRDVARMLQPGRLHQFLEGLRPVLVKVVNPLGLDGPHQRLLAQRVLRPEARRAMAGVTALRLNAAERKHEATRRVFFPIQIGVWSALRSTTRREPVFWGPGFDFYWCIRGLWACVRPCQPVRAAARSTASGGRDTGALRRTADGKPEHEEFENCPHHTSSPHPLHGLIGQRVAAKDLAPRAAQCPLVARLHGPRRRHARVSLGRCGLGSCSNGR